MELLAGLHVWLRVPYGRVGQTVQGLSQAPQQNQSSWGCGAAPKSELHSQQAAAARTGRQSREGLESIALVQNLDCALHFPRGFLV